jgi:hypothetical protein
MDKNRQEPGWGRAWHVMGEVQAQPVKFQRSVMELEWWRGSVAWRLLWWLYRFDTGFRWPFWCRVRPALGMGGRKVQVYEEN